MGDLIVGAIVFTAIGLASFKVIKDKRSNGACNGCCGSCPKRHGSNDA